MLGTDGIRSASGILSDSAIQAEPVPLVCIQRFPGNSAWETPVRALSFQADFRLRPVSVSPAGSAGSDQSGQAGTEEWVQKTELSQGLSKDDVLSARALMNPVRGSADNLQTDRKMLRQL